MKRYLDFLLLFLFAVLIALPAKGQECAANAGGDRSICFNDLMSLSAPNEGYYNIPPNAQWTYLSGPLSTGQIVIENPDDFQTNVVNISGSLNWPTGDYVFQFCVDCSDTNHDGHHDRMCDEVTISVKPQVTTPVITEHDEQQDGVVSGCFSTTFDLNLSSLADDETYTFTFTPSDEDLEIDIQGNQVTVTTKDGDYCDYTFVYTITNGGCVKTASVDAHFGHPEDPNHDGIIEARIDFCPSCTTEVKLDGNIPGCSGSGTWSVIGYPTGVTPPFDFTDIDTGSGDAKFNAPAKGHYVFMYTATNPYCPESNFSLECEILDIGTIELGPTQNHFYCDGILPEGNYPFCFEYFEDAHYEWYTTNPNVNLKIDSGSPNCINIQVEQPIDLSVAKLVVRVSATRIFVDKDCDGAGFELLQLPYTNIPNESLSDILAALDENNLTCRYLCDDYTFLQLFGAPTPKIKSETTTFLCSQGVESVKLKDYYEIVNGVSVDTKITVVDQPICTMPFDNLSPTQTISLNVNSCTPQCGLFRFKIDLTAKDPGTGLLTPCVTTFYLTFILESEQTINAGTDQANCAQNVIRLNGTNDYCNAVGTWTQVSCNGQNYYQVEIEDIHSPTTRLFIHAPNDSVCPPDTLCFAWTFNNAQGSCEVSDTTRLIILDDCCHEQPCPQRLQVYVNCHENTLTLTVKDILGVILNPSEYIVRWSPLNITGNPVTIPYTGVLHYTVEIYKLLGGDTICYNVLTGTAKCDPVGCDAKVIETCAANGDIILTLVDVNTNLPITLQTGVRELFWYIYGGGANDNSYYQIPMTNPVTINSGACYSFRYTHFIPYPGTNCTWLLPKTCPSITCPGPCSDFDDFMIAGCGDLLDVSLNLNFSDGCYSVCNPSSNWVTLGVFHKTPPYNPVTAPYNILWKNGANTTFVNGNLSQIDRVTITGPDGCEWKDGYTPECPCTSVPTNVRCEIPIIKYCRPDGSFYYIVSPPQIIWTPVPGATGYVLEITTGSFDGCCTMQASTYTVTVNTPYWSIPANLYCFSVRVRAVIPYCSTTTPWSEPYMYCPAREVCPPNITVCGCCQGERSAENSGLPVHVVSEEELLAYLQANPGTEYATLRDAMTAAGVQMNGKDEFRVFPNPANDRIVVQPANDMGGIYSVQLTDLLGRPWFDQKFDAARDFSINVSDLPKSVYLVTIRNARGDRMLTEKITVIK